MKRESNIELLRIISMLLIVAHHFAVHSGFVLPLGFSINKFVVQILAFGGKLGVDLFVLISGYFMVKSEFKIRKLIQLLIQTSFYSIVIYFLTLSITGADNLEAFLHACVPLIYDIYWFVTVYVVLYVFSGFINRFIYSLNQKQHLKLVVGLAIVFSVLPTFLDSWINAGLYLWFVVLYLIAAYIRLYNPDFLKHHALMAGILLYSVILLSRGLCDYISNFVPSLVETTVYYPNENNTFVLVVAILLFAGFRDLKIGYSKWINLIAKSTLGVYLIHDHAAMRIVIWNELIHATTYFDSRMFPLYAIASIVIVFCGSALIDTLYHLISDRLINRIVMKRTLRKVK